MDKKKSFWSNGLSIDETRLSAVIVVFILGAVIAFYQVIFKGDITDGLLQFLLYLLTAIAGINISESIVRGLNKKKDESITQENVTEYSDPINGVDEK